MLHNNSAQKEKENNNEIANHYLVKNKRLFNKT